MISKKKQERRCIKFAKILECTVLEIFGGMNGNTRGRKRESLRSAMWRRCFTRGSYLERAVFARTLSPEMM